MPHSKSDSVANAITCGDALKLIPTLSDRSVALALFSPPYAEQRKEHYASVPERNYPKWMCRVMAALRRKLTDDGSVLIVIRSHVRAGVVSDYVLRTRLALREDGWCECEELIWLKPDAPPLGSTQRPRRTWEHIWWFSRTPKPYMDLNASGDFSSRIGFGGSHRLRNGNHPIATKRPSKLQIGQARTPDHFTARVSENESGIRHPAMFPTSLCEKLIRTFSREGDLVLDPFCGSGTTMVAAQRLGRTFVGFDVDPQYVRITQERLEAEPEKGDNPTTAANLGKPVRLRPGFPQAPSQQRAHLLSLGLNMSDVRVFNLIFNRTVNAKGRAATVALSLSELASLTGFSRRTAIRSVERLRQAEIIVTARNGTLHHHEGSLIGFAPDLLVPVWNGDTSRRGVTNRLGGFEPNNLYPIDCIDGMKRLPDQSVDVVLTDLPHDGLTENHWDCRIDLNDLWCQIGRLLKKNGAVVMTAAAPFNAVLMMSKLSWFRHEWIWQKDQGTNFLNASVAPLRNHESVLVFCEGSPAYHPQMELGTPYKTKKTKPSSNWQDHRSRSHRAKGYDVPVVTVNGGWRFPKTVLRFDRDRNNIHPTQKPVALFEYLLKTYSDDGAFVLDCCIGSGTTGIAAMNTGRSFIGFESDPEMCDKAAARLQEHSKAR